MCLLLLLLRYSHAHREHLKNSTLHFVAAVCIVAIIVHDCRMPVKTVRAVGSKFVPFVGVE